MQAECSPAACPGFRDKIPTLVCPTGADYRSMQCKNKRGLKCKETSAQLCTTNASFRDRRERTASMVTTVGFDARRQLSWIPGFSLIPRLGLARHLTALGGRGFRLRVKRVEKYVQEAPHYWFVNQMHP